MLKTIIFYTKRFFLTLPAIILVIPSFVCFLLSKLFRLLYKVFDYLSIELAEPGHFYFNIIVPKWFGIDIKKGNKEFHNSK